MNAKQNPKPDASAKTLSEELTDQIKLVADRATDADRKLVGEMIERARAGKHDSEIRSVPPAACALLFLKHNPHNRDWSPAWSQELARRMKAGQWMWNNASFGFYVDGALSDGQNRAAGSALSDMTIETAIVYGADRASITTIDGGRARHAADAAKLDGIQNSRRKEQIVKLVAIYMTKCGDKEAALRSPTEICREIEGNNVRLEDAIEIGQRSKQGVVSPQLNETVAQTVAYLMLRGGWPVDRIREKLAAFQAGVTQDDPDSVFFLAGKRITASHEGKGRKEKLTTTKEVGMVLFAMIETEKGAKVIQKRKLDDAVRKEMPNPAYPGASQAHEQERAAA